VFEIPPAESLEAALSHDLDLTTASLFDVRRLNAVAHRLGKKASVHVKVDTGMGRLGFVCEDAVGAVTEIASLDALRLTGLYSHFATSEDPDRSFAVQQINRFRNLQGQLESLGVSVPLKHMANSGAIIDFPEAHFDMVRPGIMLYGYPPSREMRERYPVAPVLSLVSQVTFLKTVGPNTSISYGRRYFTTQETTIATIPVGYADGLSRLLTAKAEALIRGKHCPVVGTICMDAVMIDLGSRPDVEVGDSVTFIGRQGHEAITAWDLAGKIGTIPYEVTSLITERVPRVYVNP
jgi:alanine racemase